MEYRQTDGKTRRVHKQYVDVVARILAGGQVVPVTVCAVAAAELCVVAESAAGAVVSVCAWVSTAFFSWLLGC
jgi:hypothetical protein